MSGFGGAAATDTGATSVASRVAAGAKALLVLGPSAGTGKLLMIALVIGIVIATIVMIADNSLHFLPVNPLGSGPSSAARAGKKFWKTVGTDSENLIVPASQSPTVSASQYTVSVQMIIGDTRTPSLGKFRHVLHRGSNPCGLSSTTAGSTGHSGIKPGDLPPSNEQTYTDMGLPALMNPGLMLDKYKNDLHVFVHTRGKEDGMDVLWLESLTIEDLPLNTPITMGVVCNGRTLEVYVNCKLYSTLMLRGVPYLPPTDNQWFGRYCAYPMTGLLKNLQLWADALGPSDYTQMCSGGKFSDSDMPTSCPTASSS
jgi:hypothetical protein